MKKILPAVTYFRSIKTLISFLIFFSWQSIYAQIDCSAGKFYGIGTDNKIHEMTLTGSSITLGSSSPTLTQYNRSSLAIANLGSGNSFYSSGTETTVTAFNVLQYSTSSWINLFPNSWKRPLHNAGANGNKLYYQYIGANYNSDSSRYSKIYSFNGSTLNLLYCDTNVHMQVADIAVDSDGNIYFFSGPQKLPSTAVSALNVISPTGSLLASYPVSFDANLAYGCFLMGSVLYVGFQNNTTYPDQLVPFTLNNGKVVIGTPLAVPKPVIGGTVGNPTYLRFTDLASCNSGKFYVKPTNTVNTVGLNSTDEDDEFIIYPNPVNDKINIKLQKYSNGQLTIYDSTGKIILTQQIDKENIMVDVVNFNKGIYFVQLISNSKNYNKLFLKN